ncbi:MAG: helix-turn-helix transcriptional regulator [Balneolaceae bacterium]|nr:helix-turn-helix transcriptional regulator [Balneolaceae bacterium]
MKQLQSSRILQEYKEGLSRNIENCSPQVKNVVNYIHEHLFNEELTVSSIQQACNIHRKSFSSRFKLYMGRSPCEYYIHHRIEAVKLLLLQNELTITETGLLVGFSSLSAFCNTFKRKEGIKPSEWRLRNGGGKNI